MCLTIELSMAGMHCLMCVLTALQQINSKIVLNVNCNQKHKVNLNSYL